MLLIWAEEEGFEPPLALTKTVFKTAAFNRSATLPNRFLVKRCKSNVYFLIEKFLNKKKVDSLLNLLVTKIQV